VAARRRGGVGTSCSSLRALEGGSGRLAGHRPSQETYERLLEADREDLSPNERVALALALEDVDPDRWCVQVDPPGGSARIIRR
jgi:hypothetical protein